jgi:hypothetical protein
MRRDPRAAPATELLKLLDPRNFDLCVLDAILGRAEPDSGERPPAKPPRSRP